MKIGLLKVGRVTDELHAKYGEYPPMFPDLLSPAAPEAEFRNYYVLRGERPGSPEECDGWMISGSAQGVYDDDPWIEWLRGFLREAREQRCPMVGICFGHQIMAEALGGAAALSPKGWGVGVHHYEVKARPGWMADAPEALALHAMHRDQVTRIPEDATVLATSAFCEYAMLAYGDPERPCAISIQPHPEFERPFAEDLVQLRTDDGKIPAEVGKPALATYGMPVDNAPLARWIMDYFRARLDARAAA
ncbi:MAG: gamma-glutamyl-gamma-aminobutyrate hydrolase family protein [Pseudomonadota bacterium]